MTLFSVKDFSVCFFRIKSVLRECLEAIQSVEYASVKRNTKIEKKAQAIPIACVADSQLEYVRRAYKTYKNLKNYF